MTHPKKIQDPLYSYIELDKIFISLINTPEFQRLRNIRQTSYESLYPSALHNRFVHSLGVFHLGVKGIDSLNRNISDLLPELLLENTWEIVRQTFLCACLLHDVGHSPFSHTGEEYYTKGINFALALKQALEISNAEETTISDNTNVGALKKYQFCQDIKRSENGTGKPHEAMSALIGLDLCNKLNIQIDKDLFVRCIIGVKYTPNENVPFPKDETAILNAIIGLLNGSLIDVDKLDYTIRDSYVTGYNNMTIDLNRLLAGYTLYRDNTGNLEAGYKKGALSVIENVIFANDLERRWIQNHPTILYDCLLVDTLLEHFDNHMRQDSPEATVFTRQALSLQGMSSIKYPLKLLNDADIIAYIKNTDNSETGQQYLSRDQRLVPLWKTEAAFGPLSKDFGSALLQDIQKDFTAFLDILNSRGEPFIDDNALLHIESFCNNHSNTRSFSTTHYKKALNIGYLFKSFQENLSLPDFKFVLILNDRFRTNYRKIETSAIKVELDTCFVPLQELMSVQANKTISNMNKAFFYVYTTKRNIGNRKDLGGMFFDFLRRNYRR